MDIFSALITDAQQVPLATFSWNEGVIFDLWTFIHIAVAISGGTLIRLLKMRLARGLLLILVLASVWEVFEYITNVFEVYINVILDVVVALIISAVTYLVLPKDWSSDKLLKFFCVFLVISVVLLGFRFLALL